ncbi:MAG: hypothetical protein JXJ17_15585 [Anaerolineae bacterium]|nr:hypothetical protein [Anaerolineae bacterium]
MAKSKKKSHGFQNALLFVMTATLGAVGVFLYLIERQKEKAGEKSGEKSMSLARKPVQAITIKPKKKVEMAAPALTLSLSAEPKKFVRRQEGMIRAKTQPGAACVIMAKYSTKRAPTTLSSDPVKADENGIVEWRWEIGTGGSFVEVTVEASREGDIPVSASLKTDIVD